MKILADEMDMDEHGFERGFREGREEGIEEGREEGERDAFIKVAIDMKNEGMNVELIHRLTHLSLEDIEKL